ASAGIAATQPASSQSAAAQQAPPAQSEPSGPVPHEVSADAMRGAAAAPAPHGRAPMRVDPSEAPAVLFAQANRARRDGRIADAIALYRRLEHEYADSMQARDARVSLGQLYLRGGSAKLALAEFNDYLTRGGALSAEAMWGRANALAELGR